MRRVERIIAALTFAVTLAWPAAAQRVGLDPGGTVTFAPSPEAISSSFACQPPDCLVPSSTEAASTLRILRQNPRNRSDLVIDAGRWRSAAGGEVEIDLFVRLEIDGNRSDARTTEWLPASSVAVEVALPDDPRVDVRIAFQLRPRAAMEAGTARTSVRYRFGDAFVEQQLLLAVPDVTLVRVIGEPLGTGASVAFDYAPDLFSYLDALERSVPLPVTNASLDTVEVYSTSPSGWEARAERVPSTGEDAWLDGVLRLAGVAVDSFRVRGQGPTEGFETLLGPGDYTIDVTGAELAGRTFFMLRFTARSLP